MLNEEKATLCSAQIIKGLDQCNIKYTLVSPYCEDTKIFYDNVNEVIATVKGMPLSPVKDLSIKDLPIISDDEASKIKPGKSIYQYFRMDNQESTKFEGQRKIYYGTSGLETEFDIGSMEAEYRAYQMSDLAQKIYSKKVERLSEMPKEVKMLVFDEYEQGTLESRMEQYKKFMNR